MGTAPLGVCAAGAAHSVRPVDAMLVPPAPHTIMSAGPGVCLPQGGLGPEGAHHRGPPGQAGATLRGRTRAARLASARRAHTTRCQTPSTGGRGTLGERATRWCGVSVCVCVCVCVCRRPSCTRTWTGRSAPRRSSRTLTRAGRRTRRSRPPSTTSRRWRRCAPGTCPPLWAPGPGVGRTGEGPWASCRGRASMVLGTAVRALSTVGC